MPAPKGHPKWGGKKKGCKHVKLAGTVRERLEEMGCDPVAGLATIALDPLSSRELQAHCLAKLSRFCYPELRSVEHNAGAGFVGVIKRVMGVADDAI